MRLPTHRKRDAGTRALDASARPPRALASERDARGEGLREDGLDGDPIRRTASLRP